MTPPSSRLRRAAPVRAVGIVCLALVMSLVSPTWATVGAQSPSPEAGGSAFAFTAWELVELTTSGNPPATPATTAPISLVFGEDGAVTVESICATASGTMALHDDGSVVPNLAVPTGDTSHNQCERESVEERFLNLVNLATTWTLEDDRLTLALMDGGTIVLRQAIMGTTWQWVGFQGGDGATVDPDSAEPITMVFGTDGMLTLTTACRTATMPYTLEGTRGLSLDTSRLSEVTCADGARLYADLGAMRSYVFRDGRLWVSLMADAGIHEFVAVAAKG